MRVLFCEEFLIGLDGAFFPAEYGGIRGFDVPEEVQNFSHRLHPPIAYLAVQWGKLGGIALDDEHPAANSAHRSANNFHE
jgi:hypothetical protein